ncbi:glycosyl hydrolase family 8 [Telmatospirillum siberiense]|uniref:cellulase n=1 Tax=Telmatospirillum siberiense TaxID=382514 RepID=A0A2N3PZC9_9PROT|nr:glycosyl hydrolase family 8 [Telmatospirillum siberiense]PKU25748.1 hypothetical protein CWS72_04055 [Telmatospirillum siberiense]
MTRTAAPILIGLFAFLFLPLSSVRAAESEVWTAFKARFISAEGRVVDTGNGNISHSEGQGYAMLAAVAFDDPSTFRLLRGWTYSHLGHRPDGLFSWRWSPSDGGSVTDENNATDGDLLIAWALARAAERWGDAAFRADASKLAAAVLTSVVRTVGGVTVLLPGVDGFVHDDRLVLNPSYWIFPAFTELDKVMPSPEWSALRSSGLVLLEAARFGRRQLPSDWIQLSTSAPSSLPLARRLAPAQDTPPTFGYDAIRVPLYLVWGKEGRSSVLDAFLRYWGGFASVAGIPAKIDVETGTVTSYSLSRGGQAIVALVEDKDTTSGDRAIRVDDDYYSSVLFLMTQVAAIDLGRAKY